MPLAPIALFTYNRPEHTRKTIHALANNELAAESALFIFSDAPRDDKANKGVCDVRDFIKNLDGFCTVTIIERSENYGLSRSIISGVSDLVAEFGRVIVLEDDLVTSPHFLSYMNNALNYYADEERVISIHGYVYPVKEELPETFFLRGADCWGWATWKRGWKLFEPDGSQLLQSLKEKHLERSFDLDGAYSYTKMLKRQTRGENNSWAVRWHASAFLTNSLTLYPGKSLVQNIGYDASGVNCAAIDHFNIELSDKPIIVTKIAVEEDTIALSALKKYFRSLKLSFSEKMAGSLKKRFGRIFSLFNG
jgi:hypothetical protein